MDNLTRVESIFFAALEKDSAEQRAAYLDEACGQNLELRAEVERLLDAHPNAGSFLNAAADFGATIDASTITESAGTLIGPYKLLQQIGEGGMGVVWMAEQTEPVRRTVALKIIKPGMDSSQVIARFEAERQALALMDHPNIARVLDAGTTDSGRPYFVMDLVKGIPITQYCDDQRLSPAARLELLIPVCQAIQHAHQKGIIHRDIKPSNVLIASYDGRPVPKVIDFGVAKATGQKLTERTLFTGFGAIVGTLEYMSPEQAEFNALDIDTRSDIYSLGVLLYELLTGSTPLTKERLKQAAITELLRVIREEDPPPPSTRLSQSSGSLESISAQRQSDAHRLPKLVRGELDWIVMKSLEKDRTRRYETANGMARDIEHYLQDEPVEACPPSATYRLRKFVRRNKGSVVAVSLIVLTLVAGVTVASWQAIRAWRAERVATAEEQKAKQAADRAITQKDRADANAKRADANLKTAGRYLYSAHMNLAHEAWKSGNVLRVLELLNQHRPAAGQEDLRSFEWGYLWRHCNRQRKTVKLTTDEQVVAISVSPDGRWIAVGIFRGSVEHRGGEVTMGEVRLWDVSTGALRKTLVGGKSPGHWAHPEKLFQEPVFSPDGKLFAVVAFDYLDVKSGEREQTSPRIVIWDVETMKRRATIPLPRFELGDHIAISPDNKQIAAAFTRSSMVWDLPVSDHVPVGPGKLLRRQDVDVVYGDVSRFAFTADGKSLFWSLLSISRISLNGNSKFTVTNVAGTGEDVSLPIDRPFLNSVSPDGKYFTNGGGKYFTNGGGDSVVQLHEAKTGKAIHTFPAGGWNPYGYDPRARFSPDGRLLAIVKGLTVGVWDVESKQQVGDIRGHTDYIRDVGFGADSKTVTTVAKNKVTGSYEAKVWDVNTRPGPEEFSLGKFPSRYLESLGIAPDGKTLVTAGSTIRSRPDRRVFAHYDLSPASLGKQVAELPGELVTDAETSSEGAAKNFFSSQWIRISPDGKRMALSGADHGPFFRGVQLWRIAPGPKDVKAVLERTFLAPRFGSHRAPVAVFSPDGTKLAYPAPPVDGKNLDPDRLQVHDIATGKTAQFPKDPESWFPYQAGLQGFYRYGDWRGYCDGIVFSSDGNRIFTAHKRNIRPWLTYIIAWDAATGEVLSVLESPVSLGRTAQTLALSPDDRTLAICHDDHSIVLWDVSEPKLRDVRDELKRRAENKGKKPTEAASKPKAVLRGHADMITAIAFHPDGKILVSASSDRTIKLWDVITGEVRLTLEGHQADITALAFTADGNTLISADDSGAVKLWRAMK